MGPWCHSRCSAAVLMKSHVDGVTHSCFYQLRQLRSIRRTVPTDALHALAHAFNTSRIDYCNAILYWVTDTVIRRLQAMLHAAVRIITGIRWNDHITPTLRDTLHWLPIVFNIALMTYDCISIYMADHQHICVTSVYRSSPFPFAPGFALLTTMT